MCCKKVGARDVLTFGSRALTLSGKALDGPVVEALARGMSVLKLPKEREEAMNLIQQIGEDKGEDLLRIFLFAYVLKIQANQASGAALH